MKLLFIIAVACIILKATHSAPTTVSAKETHGNIPKKDVSLNPLIQAVKQYTQLFVGETEHIISHVLQYVPESMDYKDSRQTLSDYQQTNKLYSTKFANCVWNIVDFNRDMRVLLDYFGGSKATAERKEVMQLLKETGFVDLKHQVEIILVRFVSGDLGSTHDVNEDYC